jgi:hypothetical protein
MRPRFIIAACILSACALSGTASAQTYDWHWTKDPLVKDTSPCSNPAWKDSSDLRPGSLAAGDSMWIAVCNTPDSTRYKAVKFDVYGGLGSTDFGWVMESFMTDDTSEPAITTLGLLTQAVGYLGLWSTDFICMPQPKWERLKIVGNINHALPSPARIVRIATICYVPGDFQEPYLELEQASIGSIGNMVGGPQYSEVWMFPRDGSVNVEPPVFSAPAPTGIWTSAFVSTDPQGGSRPGGGVRFSTTGPGLPVGQKFSARVRVDGGNVARFDVYTRDAVSGNYQRFFIAMSPSVPGVSSWVLAALIASMAGLGAFVVRRRRALRA